MAADPERGATTPRSIRHDEARWADHAWAVPAVAARTEQPIICPYCAHLPRVRDFLSLAGPTRPARVVVHVRSRRASV